MSDKQSWSKGLGITTRQLRRALWKLRWLRLKHWLRNLFSRRPRS
jgi:hypothetical protein